MRPAKTEPVRLGRGHCCQCTAAHGGVCGHIGPSLLCHQHLTTNAMKTYLPWPWWHADDTEEYRPLDTCWDGE
jgi:hypothetical protein